MNIDIINCCFNYSQSTRKVCWLLTTSCNLNCQHCSVSSNYLSQYFGEPTNLVHAANEFLNHGITDVILSGGEPTLRRDLPTIIGYLRSLRFNVSLVTNGTLLDKEYVAKLVQSGLHKVTVGLDGATKKTHEIFRGVTGSFEKAVQGTQVLVDSGIRVTINVTLHDAILPELTDIFHLVTELRVQGVSFVFPMNCGRAAANSSSFTTVSQKRDFVLAKLQSIARTLEAPFRLQVLDPRCGTDSCPSNQFVFWFDEKNGFGRCLFDVQNNRNRIVSQQTLMVWDLHEGHMIASRRQ